nr:LPXTG cell wall anchor domain-containing protein [uncultured Ruminococcus sp.]
MFKKFLSLALIAMLVMSVCAVSFSAAQVEVAADGATTAVAEQGADGDVASQGAESDVAPTGDGVIKFDAASAGWESASSILFYIHEINGQELAAWGSKKKLGGTKGENNIWSFDAAALGVEAGKEYGIIFNNNDTSAETYDLMLTTECFGDTASANPSKMIENPVDSKKTSMEARWANTSSCGPILQATSIGNVVGETCPSGTSKYEIFVNFLKDKLENARQYAGKDDQTLLDDTAKALGLGKSDVEKAISEASVTADWSKDKSSLADESSSDVNDKGSGGSSDSGSSGSGSSGSGSSGGSSGSGSSSSSKSGSASNTQTGQTETVLFIMLGVMVAAAGVIFFARKKERA